MPDHTLVIGIAGKKRHGKDAFGRMLIRSSGMIATRISFADALKEEVAAACDLTPEYIESHKENFRLILQGWGTDYRRKLCCDSYWTDIFSHSAANSECELVVCTDVRFPNEAKVIKEMGGVLIKISRPGFKEPDSHISENSLNDWSEWDFIVDNCGDLSRLEETSRRVFAAITEKINGQENVDQQYCSH